MAEPFSISTAWINSVAEAIGSRQGVQLKNSLVAAEDGEAASLEDDSAATVSELVYSLHESIASATTQYNQYHPLPVTGRNMRLTMDLNQREQEQCIATVARVAAAGALVAYQRKHKKVVRVEVGRGEGTSDDPLHLSDEDDQDEEAELRRSAYNTLLRGLLYAFEAFQEVHSMNRDHYPPRSGHKTAGTVGWDTLVLLHFVHHIPQVARYASGAVVDEATGQIVRSWRKLLVALQTVDAQEAPEHSRRRGALALVNGLLIILFQRYNTHQCAVLLGAVDHAEQASLASKDASKSILKPSHHMVSEVVTYYYYKGRMCLYERRFDDAHAALRQAYTLLPPAGYGTEAQHRNKQRVRFFLTVAGIVSGRHVPNEILQSDDLLSLMFGPLVRSMERGDPVAFNKALEAFGSTLRRRGVYLILQQAKLLCCLMLVARVHAALGALSGIDNSRVTLKSLVTAYSFVIAEGKEEGAGSNAEAGPSSSKKRAREAEEEAEALESMNDDRMTLWVAKLIARGYIRGYLSHEHKTLVLSKKEPFPLLSTSSTSTQTA